MADGRKIDLDMLGEAGEIVRGVSAILHWAACDADGGGMHRYAADALETLSRLLGEAAGLIGTETE